MKFGKHTSTSWLNLGKDSHGIGATGIVPSYFDPDIDENQCENQNR